MYGVCYFHGVHGKNECTGYNKMVADWGNWMLKHAYLIMAHNDFGILEKLLKLLDDPRNDIYLHIDKKVKKFNFANFQKLLTKSKLYFVDRLDVRWGDFSQVQCELKLLKAAIGGEYQYYHLLSGVDLPLKSNDEIHTFFGKHQGKQFVHFTH